MAFKPHIHKPVPMNPRLFQEGSMDLLADLLNQKLSERVSYDPVRNILFVNLEAWSVRKKQDVVDLQKVLSDACKAAGRRVNSLVNQDGCRIAEDLYDEYADMVAYMVKHHYAGTARYATSVITRTRLQDALRRRGLETRVYESAEEARAALGEPAMKGAAAE
jgi:propionate CoA-transferase